MLAWDVLFSLFVAAPMLTGGLWIRSGSLKIEYTQPGAAALVLFLWALWLWKRGRNPLTESRILSLLTRIWEKWAAALEKSFLPLLGAWVSVALIWFLAAYSRHQGFESHAADMGIFTNGIWNLNQTGSPYSSIKGGISLLADHQDFLVYPIAWLSLTAPAALLALQALALSATGVAAYLLGRQRLGAFNRFPPLLPFLVWACAPLRAANLFDFHPEVLMLPLFLFGAWALQSSRWRARAMGIALFLLALLAKESAGPVACGIGLAWCLGAGPFQSRRFTRWAGAGVILVGIAWFIVDTKILPHHLGSTYAYADMYAPFGSSLGDLIRAPFLYPSEFFARLLGPARLKFFFGLLLPFFFLPLLGWPAFIAALPGFLMLFLSAGTQRLSLGFHYAIEPLVGVLFALPAGLGTKFSQRHARWLFLLLPMAALLQFGRSEAFHWRIHSLPSEQIWVRDRLLPSIPPNLSVSANSALVPHLAQREWVHFLPNLKTEKENPVNCVVWDQGINQTPLTAESMAHLRIQLAEGYETELACGSTTLYRHKGTTSCLTHPLACP